MNEDNINIDLHDGHNNPGGHDLRDNNANHDDELLAEAAQVAARRRKRLAVIIAASVAALLIVGGLIYMFVAKSAESAQKDEQIEQLQLEMEMMQSANELAQLDREYAQLEGNQINLLANDSIVEKYAQAKAQVEKLMLELKNEKAKSADQIAKLKAEIATLKGILRDYTERINALMAENEGLKEENTQVKNENRQLSSQVSQNQQTIRQQSERLTLAEKLNVTGLNLIALNKKGKKEKNITKAVQLEVTFTIPQNNTTAPGEKIIYLRITNPEGDLLSGNGGSFPFEGSTLSATARRSIEYANEEIGGVAIFYDINTTLTPGDYQVELFCDGFRLASRRFAMSK